jgi:hypothetical protein
MGLDKGVAQYHGTQYHASLEAPIPAGVFFAVVGEGSVWTSWPEDRPEDQRVGPWGVTARISGKGTSNIFTYATSLTSALPAAPQAKAGHRNHFDAGIQQAKEYLLEPTDNYLVSIDPKLVTPNGEPCPENWRETDTQCVIEVGESDDGPVTKGFKTAAAISAMTGGFTLAPQATTVAASAIAIGYLKKADTSIGQYCGKQ